MNAIYPRKNETNRMTSVRWIGSIDADGPLNGPRIGRESSRAALIQKLKALKFP